MKEKKPKGAPRKPPTKTMSVRHTVELIDSAKENNTKGTLHRDLQKVIERYAAKG